MLRLSWPIEMQRSAVALVLLLAVVSGFTSSASAGSVVNCCRCSGDCDTPPANCTENLTLGDCQQFCASQGAAEVFGNVPTLGCTVAAYLSGQTCAQGCGMASPTLTPTQTPSPSVSPTVTPTPTPTQTSSQIETENGARLCGDHLDNDSDQLIDCADPDCAATCAASAPVLNGPWRVAIMLALLAVGCIPLSRQRRAR